MKIEIYFDYTCPYCYLTYTRLNKAIEKLPFASEVSLVHRSFQLDPYHPTSSNISTIEEFARIYNIEESEAKKNLEYLTILGKKDNITFNFDINIPTNTLDAHRITKFSKFARVEKKFINDVFKAHFSEGKNISECSVLMEIGKKVGLDTVLVSSILKSSEYLDVVNADFLKARKSNITKVPFIIINNKYIIEKDKSIEFLYDSLIKIYETEQKTTYCDSGNCI